MSYSAYGQTSTPGVITLPTGQMVVTLPDGSTYTIGGTQADPDAPKPKEPSEASMKWAEFATAAVGATVGIVTLIYMLKGKRKS
jgi:hypothetical protein